MPSLEQLLLVALGLSCFYPGSSTRSCPPSWATLVWDVPPLELEEKGAAHKGITAPQLLCWSIPALCLLLLGVFLGCSLCRKARSCWRKVREGVRAGGWCQAAMGTRKVLPRLCPAPAGRGGSGSRGENQDRLSIPGNWNELGFKGPSNPNHSTIPTRAAPWGSSARPECLQERPEVPLSLSPRCHPVPCRDLAGRMDAPARPPSCSPS